MGEGLLAMIAANVQRDTRECYLLPDRRMDGWMDVGKNIGPRGE